MKRHWAGEWIPPGERVPSGKRPTLTSTQSNKAAEIESAAFKPVVPPALFPKLKTLAMTEVMAHGGYRPEVLRSHPGVQAAAEEYIQTRAEETRAHAHYRARVNNTHRGQGRQGIGYATWDTRVAGIHNHSAMIVDRDEYIIMRDNPYVRNPTFNSFYGPGF